LITFLLQQPVFFVPVPTVGKLMNLPLLPPKTPSEVLYYVKSIFSRGGMLCSITRRFYLLIEENHLNPAIAESLLIPFTAKDMGPLTRSSPHLSQLHLLLQPGLL
jgi:hypothetical protein